MSQNCLLSKSRVATFPTNPSSSMSQYPPGLQKREDLRVQYYPGIGSEGTDDILRPTLMTVGNQGRCYRIVQDSFGKKEGRLWVRGSASAGAGGGREPQSGGGRESQYEQQSWQPEVRESNFHHSHVEAGHHGNHRGYRASRDVQESSKSSRLPHFQDDVYDEGQETGLDLEGLEQLPGGRYSLSLSIPSAFFKYIIGTKGSTRANIEEDTKCRLRIPRRGQEGDIVVEGATPGIVSHGKQRVEMVVWTSRFKEEPNYFISIPLNLPDQTDRMETFQKQVLDLCGKDKGVVPELFQDPACFHLTLGVLRIFSDEEKHKAIRVLQEAVEGARADLQDPSVPLTIVLQSLDTMNDDLSATRVVYSRVKSTEATNRLQNFVDGIVTRFIKGAPELMRREFEREGVKLHATVMNCSFLSRHDASAMEMEVHKGRRRQKTKETFDSRDIFKQFKSYDFGKLELSNIHLSKRFERDSDGYYKCIHNYAI